MQKNDKCLQNNVIIIIFKDSGFESLSQNWFCIALNLLLDMEEFIIYFNINIDGSHSNSLFIDSYLFLSKAIEVFQQ